MNKHPSPVDVIEKSMLRVDVIRDDIATGTDRSAAVAIEQDLLKAGYAIKPFQHPKDYVMSDLEYKVAAIVSRSDVTP